MSNSNVLCGAPRLDGELLKLGIEVFQAQENEESVVIRLRRNRPGRATLIQFGFSVRTGFFYLSANFHFILDDYF